MRILACPDKFRGTATAAEAAAAVAAGAEAAGIDVRRMPLSDGGEGFLEAFGGPNRSSTVTGPLGGPVEAGWRMAGRTAVIEMARASGLALVGGAAGNDPVAASTAGTGELVAAALDGGARRVLVGHGGSASTDGGLAALRSMYPLVRLGGVELVAAVDVFCPFLDAATRFSPQKGATASQVELLRRRLERLAQVYLEDHGVDVTDVAGAGAAGGLAGGLAAAGADVVSGFEAVADELDLAAAIEACDLVVTGEGYLDDESLNGKVVGGVVELAAELDRPVLVVVGDRDAGVLDGAHGSVQVVGLVDRFGEERAEADTAACIAEVVSDHLDRT